MFSCIKGTFSCHCYKLQVYSQSDGFPTSSSCHTHSPPPLTKDQPSPPQFDDRPLATFVGTYVDFGNGIALVVATAIYNIPEENSPRMLFDLQPIQRTRNHIYNRPEHLEFHHPRQTSQ
eukprot:959984_1